MKFLIDAQLPRRLAHRFRDAGHDVLHTLDLPLRNRTPDATLNRLAETEARVVVTKDVDFVDSFLVHRQPPKLLLITTGNITNQALEKLLLPRLADIAKMFESHDYLELSRTALVVHE